jgi:hypothetical protein
MDLGFIIIRHVMSEDTFHYWEHCYECIRKVYGQDAPIVIIDDDSLPEYKDRLQQYATVHCRVIQSILPKRGDILGYYYLYIHRFFPKAVILHDSVFIHHYIDFQDDPKHLPIVKV